MRLMAISFLLNHLNQLQLYVIVWTKPEINRNLFCEKRAMLLETHMYMKAYTEWIFNLRVE